MATLSLEMFKTFTLSSHPNVPMHPAEALGMFTGGLFKPEHDGHSGGTTATHPAGPGDDLRGCLFKPAPPNPEHDGEQINNYRRMHTHTTAGTTETETILIMVKTRPAS